MWSVFKTLTKSCSLYFLLGMGMLFCNNVPAYSQALPDISTIRVDDLSDAQLEELVKRASESGLSERELIQMAQTRGLPAVELEKLKERLEGLEGFTSDSGRSAGVSKREPRRQMSFDEITKGLYRSQADFDVDEKESGYFGMNLFYNKGRKLTFEPNLNMATPKNYVIGAGDMLYVDIYGQSEKYYEANVTPDGVVILDNIGPISVSGLTIQEATDLIKSRLGRYYTGLSGSNPTTFLQVSLGNVRTIQVNLVGELRMPGTFTLSALSTVFNALYAAGGPTVNGTMRNVRLIRDNKTIATIDIYDLLMNGQANLNLQLQDQDVILVSPFSERVQVTGEVKRPAIFEIKEGETLKDILEYAGGFTDEAFRDRISVTRTTAKDKAVSDVYADQMEIFTAKGGDKYHIGKILDRFANRVQIKGAVFREGNYALTEGLTLMRLIEKAEGLRGEAYLANASILRTMEDLSTEIIPINLREIMAGSQEDVRLRAEDVVKISSIYDIGEEFYVKITGEVKEPGTYPFSQSMTVEELVISAGGLRESASVSDIEIARRTEISNARDISDIISVSINRDLTISPSSMVLKPFDNVIIRRKPNFSLEKIIQIEGQVNSPGEFAVKNAEERISDVIKRAGGLTEFAYPKGATLIRRTEFYQTESERIQKKRNLENLLERIAMQNEDPTESQMMLLRRLGRSNLVDSIEYGGDRDELIRNVRAELLEEMTESNAGIGNLKIKETEAIAIDLEEIIKNPASKYDLIVEEGDIISVPKMLQTVRLRGDVIYPTTVRYEDFRSMRYYINRAGGFDNRAKKKRTYVVYANGEVARTKSILFYNIFPSVEPGAEIIVPTKGPKLPIRPGEVVGVTTGLATLALILTQINW